MTASPPSMGDRLQTRIRAARSLLCVGLDPTLERIPDPVRSRPLRALGHTPRAAAQALFDFSLELLDALAPLCAAVKLQSACFELLGEDGVAVLARLASEARQRRLFVVGDVKRGDIPSSSELYARAYLGNVSIGPEIVSPFAFDAVTVHPFLGYESIQPFLEAGSDRQAGVFCLVRTSNRGAADLQDLPVAPSSTPFYLVLARAVERWGADWLGPSGWSSLGVVAGATRPDDLPKITAAVPHAPLLIPGLGAQGGRPSDLVRALPPSNRPTLVTASRSIIYAHESKPSRSPWTAAARDAAERLRDDLAPLWAD